MARDRDLHEALYGTPPSLFLAFQTVCALSLSLVTDKIGLSFSYQWRMDLVFLCSKMFRGYSDDFACETFDNCGGSVSQAFHGPTASHWVPEFQTWLTLAQLINSSGTILRLKLLVVMIATPARCFVEADLGRIASISHNWQHPCFNRNYACFPRKSFQLPCRRSSWTPSSSGWPTTLSRNENMQIKATTSQEVRPKVLLCMFYPPTWHPQRVIGMIWWGSVTSLLVGDGRCPRDGAGAGPGVLLQSYRAATVGARTSQSSQSSPSRPQVKACQSNIKIFQIVVQFGMMCMSCMYVCV